MTAAGLGPQLAQGSPAGLVSRALAALVDALVVAGLGLAAELGGGAARLLVAGPPFRVPDPPAWLTAVSGSLIAVLYLTAGWALAGRTAGGQVLGLRVIARSGRRLGIGRALLRAVLCLVFPLGLLWVPLSRRSASAQDLVLASTVIHDWVPRHARPRSGPGRE
ncbi:RDD family protein [Streptomyces flavofungini]|uniref:RDD family protein n=1 Tax=Streptomyces flavofungini TaxID=68200 RepID=UPI0025B0638C|nr:RDD family protein [Streptomyces flavofungini]WJV50648.1 RDD family protein [Streptomyces flavofungini]